MASNYDDSSGVQLRTGKRKRAAVAEAVGGTEASQRSRTMHVPEPEDINLMCPISQDLFEDPVVASDGNTYSRAGIEQWFRSGHRNSPLTQKRLKRDLFPNRIVAQNVQQYKMTLGMKLIELIERCPDNHNCEGLARDMLDEGKVDLNARRERDRRTPLLVAAELGLRGLVETLVRKGADYKATDSDGKGVEDLFRGELEAWEKSMKEEAKQLEVEKKKATTGVDWDAVERVVGKYAADQMKQGEGFTGELNLCGKSITAEGCRTIAPALRTMPNLDRLFLHNNNIGDEGLAVLSNVVDAIPMLDYLRLSDNKIGNVGCQCLLELIENDSLQSLTELYLNGNPNISSKLKTKFKRVWSEKGKSPNDLNF